MARYRVFSPFVIHATSGPSTPRNRNDNVARVPSGLGSTIVARDNGHPG